MKLLNTYLKYDGKITEEQFNQCIEIAKSLGYIVKKHCGFPVSYEQFVSDNAGYLRLTNISGSCIDKTKPIICMDNNSNSCERVTLQDILNCKQSITFNYLIL